MMRTAGATAEGAQATFVTTIQLSLAAGSALGGLVVDHASLTPTFLLAAAIALTGVTAVAARSTLARRAAR
jgi:predicted MFS family arabinose efflux permease